MIARVSRVPGPFTVLGAAPALALLLACSRGSFPGEVTSPDTAPPERGAPAAGATAVPAASHENVEFNWKSGDDAVSGTMQTTMPTGETFSGKFHEITRTTRVDDVGDFYNTWYADTWRAPRWSWGEAWPTSGSVEEFITRYTGKVVATLKGDRGTEMRCHFKLDDPDRGLKGGGAGECQLSTGERITTRLPPG